MFRLGNVSENRTKTATNSAVIKKIHLSVRQCSQHATALHCRRGILEGSFLSLSLRYPVKRLLERKARRSEPGQECSDVVPKRSPNGTIQDGFGTTSGGVPNEALEALLRLHWRALCDSQILSASAR